MQTIFRTHIFCFLGFSAAFAGASVPGEIGLRRSAHWGMLIIMAKQQFKIIIEQDEDNFFVASVPALPGCHTQAKTFTELKKRIRGAIALCLEEAEQNPRYRSRLKQLAYVF